MKKKRLTKSEKEALNKIEDIQLRTLINLKSRTEVLIKCAQETLKKVEEKGLDNYYSQNSDVLRYAQEVWSSSYRLGILKAMHDDIVYTFGKEIK